MKALFNIMIPNYDRMARNGLIHVVTPKPVSIRRKRRLRGKNKGK